MHKTNVLLVAFSGYPEINSTWLHLDNGLALLAGALVAGGHRVRIKDLQTLDVWGRLYPHEHKAEHAALYQEFERYVHNRGCGASVDDSVITRAKAYDQLIVERNSKVTGAIAHEVAEEFQVFAPHVIGFKLWSQNSFQDQILLARRLRQAFPNALIVAGGPAVELLQEAVLRHTDAFDLLIYGPGEQTLVDIADQKAKGNLEPTKLSSVIYRGPDGQIVKTARHDPRLASGVIPCYQREVYVDYDKKLHNVHVESDRGCNFLCEFCIHPLKSGRQQKKTAEEFVQELAQLNKEYGFSYFHLAGSDPPYRHMVEISRAVVDSGLDFGFMGFQSLRALDEPGLKLMQRANFDRLWVGIESGDSEIVFDIQKGRKLERLEARSEMVREHGIAITGSIITPCPGEREGSVDATITLLQKIRPDVVLAYPPLVQPGSTWMNSSSYPISIGDRHAVEDIFAANGMEWHTGFRILPTAFFDSRLDELIQINGKSYSDAYCQYMYNRRKISKETANRSSVSQFADRNKHRSLLKQLYFRAQVGVSNAIRTGSFNTTQETVDAYNRFVLKGGYSAAA